MELITDIIFSIPIGIIYSIFIQKLSEVIFTDLPYNDKCQKSASLIFFAGIIGLVLAQTIFTYNKTFQNKIVKHGLVIGGVILILYSIINYWNKMTDEIKLIIAGIALGSLLWYSYYITRPKKVLKY